MRFVLSSASIAILIASAGCSSSSDTTTDGGAGSDGATTTDGGSGADGGGGDDASSSGDGGGGMDSSFVGDAGSAALGAQMPTVVALNANAVIAHPKVMPITYDSDTKRTDIEAFIPNYAASTAWAAQTAEYGVGALTMATPRHIAGTAPATINDSDVQGMLTANLGGASPAWGAPDPSTIYAFFFPAGTITDDGSGSKSCTDYDGYHYDFAVGSVTVSYAIIVSCPGFDGTHITDLQQLTIVAGHEIVEAVTDPIVDNNPGFAQNDDAHIVWSYVTGGEVGDMCAYADTYAWKPADMNYSIQRTWSNAAAVAGKDPCVGDGATPYYQAIPTLPDMASIDPFGGGAVSTKALKIAVGASGTLTLTVYGDPGSGPFTVTVDDYNNSFGLGAKLLDITMSSSAPVAVGETIQANITVVKKDQGLGNGEVFVVNTKPASGNGPTTYYYGVIGQ